MEKKAILKTTLVFLFILLFFSCKQNEPDEGFETTEQKYTTEIHNYLKKKYDIKTALSVGIKGKDFSFHLNSGYSSLQNKMENTDETLHYVYSISKTFVASLILKLIDENKLTLKTKLSDYFTDLNETYINIEATIEDLLTHKSGIQDFVNNSKLLYENPFLNAEWNPAFLLNLIKTPATEIGQFSYSSTNYILLGMIIEKVTGQKVNELLGEAFLKPLNLSNTKLPPQDTVEYEKISHPHVYPNTDFSLVGDEKNPIDITSVIPTNGIELIGKSSWAAGGMVSKANEIAHWGYDLFSQNGKVAKPIKDAIFNSVKDFTKEDAEAYGFGGRKIFYKDEYFIGSYGRSIGSENCMFYNPTKDICITILTSSNSTKDGLPNIDELLFLLYEASV